MIIELIKDSKQRNRYRELSPAEQEQVRQIVKRHIAACIKQEVPAEIEATFREAIELVVKHSWDPDRPLDYVEPRRQYSIYIPPIKEAA